jgi:hypothetical protein
MLSHHKVDLAEEKGRILSGNKGNVRGWFLLAIPICPIMAGIIMCGADHSAS